MVKVFPVVRILLMLAVVQCCPRDVKAEDMKTAKSAIQVAEEYYKIGKDFLASGEYRKADEAFKKSEAILDNMGEKLTVRNNIKGDEISDKAAMESSVAEIDEHNILEKAESFYQQGKTDQALDLYVQALKYYPKNYNIHYNLGIIYLGKQDYKNAMQEFEAVIKLHPRDADAYYNLGVIHENFLNDTALAANYYKKYLKFTPKGNEKNMVKKWVDYIDKSR